MNCRQCDYRLWNLRSRNCPECGRGFRPSDYDFLPGAVQYLCPHCSQCYYGTDPKGHLVPRQFLCVQCGQSVEMDDCIVRPLLADSEEVLAGVPIPWRSRSRLGTFRAWLDTVGMSMTRPGELIRQAPEGAATREGLGFALLTLTIGLLGFLLLFGLVLLIAAMITTRSEKLYVVAGIVLMMTLGLLIGFALFLWLWAVLAHFLLRVTGPTQFGYSRTWQAICYSSGPAALTVVVCLPYVGLIWWLVCAVLMLRAGQGVNGWRASLAGLGPLLLMWLVLGTGLFLV